MAPPVAGPTQAEVKKTRPKRPSKKKNEPVPTPIPADIDPQIAAIDPDILEGPLSRVGDDLAKRRFAIPKGKRIKPIDSPVLATADKAIPRLLTGKPTDDVKEEIAKVTDGIEDKYKIVGALVDHHTVERWGVQARLRWKLEQSLMADLEVDKLSPLEKLALLKMVAPQCDAMEKIIRAGANPMKDVEQTLKNVDATIQANNTSSMAARLKGTTPQGREIARRLAYKANQLCKQMTQANEAATAPA